MQRAADTAVRRPRSEAARPAAAPAARWLGAGLLVLAAGLALNALLGPLAAGTIEYHVADTLRHQTVGLDAATLVLVVPLAVLAGVLVLRGHPAGPVLALGPSAFTAYMMVQYVVGPEYLQRPGNNELAAPLHIVLFALGWVLALLAWRQLDAGALPRSRRGDRWLGAVVLPLLALVTFVRYVPAIAATAEDPPTDAGYLAGPAFFWTVALLDLGVLLPLLVATCAGLLRGARWARAAAHLTLGWLGLIGVAVAAMAITMWASDDPTITGGTAVFMTVLGAAYAIVAAVLLAPLLTARQGRQEVSGRT